MKRRPRLLHTPLWLAFAAACVGACIFDCWCTIRYEQRCREWAERSDRHSATAAARLKPLIDRCCGQPAIVLNAPVVKLTSGTGFQLTFELPNLFRARWPSKQQVAELLGEKLDARVTSQQKDLDTGPETIVETATLALAADHPELRIDLCFRNDEFVGYQVQPVPAPPNYPAIYSVGASARRAVLSYAHYAWLCFIPAFVLWPKRRTLIAEFMMMVALAELILQLPSLTSGRTIDAFINAVYPPSSSELMIASLGLLWGACSAQRSRRRVLCPNCDYNLIGNQSGLCPECGSPVPPESRERLVLNARQ